MITPAHAQAMAGYNRWQNQSLYGAADRLPDSERKRSRGAFFDSIHGTLSHLYFADQLWMHRFTGTTPLPVAKSIAESATAMPDWSQLKSARAAFDEIIIGWADGLRQADLEGDLTWTSMSGGRQFTRPRWLLVTHFFNHQTHHRGQAHCLLTQNGLKLDDTDLPFGPP
jgi:uncharacterized damage-inducible protein DinB